MSHDHKRGVVKDNAIAALVTSPMFKQRVEKPKKGKGAYNRKDFDKKGCASNLFRFKITA